jgi:hypothetical protein
MKNVLVARQSREVKKKVSGALCLGQGAMKDFVIPVDPLMMQGQPVQMLAIQSHLHL